MKNQFSLMLLILFTLSIGQMWAETETVTQSVENWAGISCQLTHSECANGSANAQKDGDEETVTYVKLRTNKNGNAITFEVNEGYKITGFFFRAYTNDNTTPAVLNSITYDVFNTITLDATIPTGTSKTSGTTYTYNNTSLEATNSIVLQFNNSGKQVMASIIITYEEFDSPSSAAPTVRLRGTFNSPNSDIWNYTSDFSVASDNLSTSLTLTLTGGNYWFDVDVDGQRYANSAVFTSTNNSSTGISPNDVNTMKLEANVSGEYTFIWTYATNSLTIIFPTSSVSAPTVRLLGTFSGGSTWKYTQDFTVASDNQTASLTISLGSASYWFGVDVDGQWCANGTIFTSGNNYSKGISPTEGNNMKIVTAGVSGQYTFIWTYAIPTIIGGIWYSLSDDNMTAQVIRNPGRYNGTVTLPSEITANNNSYIVTSIGNNAFSGCENLTAINIPNSVTSVGEKAFYGCTGLSSATIGNSVTSIGERAFNGCSSLSSVTIGNSVTSIGNYAFTNCSSMTSVTLPNSVISIGDFAFTNCIGLTSVTIPNSVTDMGNYAFYGCTGMSSLTIGNSVTSVGESAFSGCTGLSSATIGNSVTSVGEKAFYGCTSLSSVTIGNSVISIGERAFNGCSSLTAIIIPDKVVSIGNNAFDGCSSLNSVVLGVSVTSISSSSFYGCNSLKSMTINAKEFMSKTYTSSSNIKHIFGEKITKYIIGDSVTSIGNYAFSDFTGLTSVTFGSSLKKIGERAFSGCTGLTSITIPISLTSIGEKAFYGCNNITSVEWNAANCSTWNFGSQVTSFIFGDKVKVIPSELCFEMTQLTQIAIPTSVTKIGNQTFYGCTGLTSITIPYSVTSIGYSAFEGCTGLTSAFIDSGIISLEDYIFKDCSNLISVGIPNSVTSIGAYAFRNCKGLTSITLSNRLTSIYSGAFYGCQNLTSIDIPQSVTFIGDNAFAGCSGLTTVTIPNKVTTIGSCAFNNCTGLTSVTIGDGVTSIESNAFWGCGNLTSVAIGKSVASIGNEAFLSCWNLTSVSINSNAIMGGAYSSNSNLKQIFGSQVTEFIIGNDVESIGNFVLAGYYDLTSLTLGYNVKTIGNNAFTSCYHLTSLVIPNSVTSIGNSAFAGCSGLTSVTIGEGVTSMNDDAFNNCSNITSVTINSDAILSKAYTNSSIKNIFGNQVTEYIIGDKVTSLGKWVFSGCRSMTSVTIGQRVTRIEHGVFGACSGLTSVTIPGSVTYIENEAFNSCSGLTSVTCYAIIPPTMHMNPFKNVNCPSIPLYVPNESVLDYREAERWKDFKVHPLNPVNVTVQASATNGRVEGAGEYEIYSNVNLKVIPNNGYSFKQWSDGNKSNPRHICITQDTILNAICEQTPTVTVQASATNGRVEGAGEYEIYSNVILTVIPDNGYYFKQWSDGNTSNPRTIYLTQDTVLNAICEPIPSKPLPYNESFTSNIGEFSISDVNLGGIEYVWKWASANYGMKASAYVNNTNHATESWLISPAISLQNTTDIVLAFEHAVNKGTPNNLRVKISTDFGSSWNDLTISDWPTGTNWNFVSTSSSLNAYMDQIVKIAFVYKSTSSDCPTWEIKNFSVTDNTHQHEDVNLVFEEINNSSIRKILRNGQILILRGDKTYTITGQKIK